MTIWDVIFLVIFPSLLLLLLGLCIADHARRVAKMTEEEKVEDFEHGLW